MKEIICFFISSFFVTLTVFLSFKEYQGKFNISKSLGLIATYLIDYIIILLPYYILLITKTKNIDSIILKVFYDNYREFVTIILIFLCNIMTRLLFTKIFDIDISDDVDNNYKNTMYGLLYFILFISTITLNIDSIIFVVLFLLGTHADFSIQKHSTAMFFKNILQRIKVCIISIIFSGVFLILDKTFNCLFSLILPWIIAFILSVICLIVMMINNKTKKHIVK